MANQLTSDEVNLKRKARHRLIGAIALTLAVVVVLPMVLEIEPKSSVQDIELRIPDPDKVGELAPGIGESKGKGASANLDAASGTFETLAPIVALPSPVPQISHAAVPSAAVSTASSVPSAVSSGHIDKLDTKEKSVVKDMVDTKDKVVAKEKDKAVKDKSVVPDKPITSKQVSSNKPATSDKPASPDKSAATDKKATKDKKVAKDNKDTPAKTEDQSKAQVAGGGETFVAQVGAYSNAETAKKEEAWLKKLGYKAFTENVGGKMRVRVGPYTDRAKAEKVRKMLNSRGLHPVVISTK
jgi:DedD protein